MGWDGDRNFVTLLRSLSDGTGYMTSTSSEGGLGRLLHGAGSGLGAFRAFGDESEEGSGARRHTGTPRYTGLTFSLVRRTHINEWQKRISFISRYLTHLD